MSIRPKTRLAFAFSLAAGAVSAQPVTSVPTGADAVTGTSAASAVAPAGSGASAMTAPGVSASIVPSPALVSAPVALSAPAAAGAAASPERAASAPAPAVSAAPGAASVHAPAKRDEPSHPVAAPSSGAAALSGATRKISEAGSVDAAGGDGLAASRALDRAFDAAAAHASWRGKGPSEPLDAGRTQSVAGRFEDARREIAQKVSIANTASPADAPGLYQDAIQTAKDAVRSPAADGIVKAIRTFAARKAESSLGELAAAAYRAAAAGSAAETGRQLSAFDKWESLLGSPERPLISNASALKDGVNELLRSAQADGGRSAPHVWFVKQGAAFAAVLPGTGVAALPSLSAAFALAPSVLAPETVLSGAYRAFSSDPGASSGARLIYRARRTLGASVPRALLSASRFWLRAALKTLWRRIVSLFSGGSSYDLSGKAGQDALRRDAALSAAVRGEAAAAERALSDPRPTISGARAAFAALARSAEAYRALTGESDAAADVESLRRDFESSAASLKPGDALTPGLDLLVSGPGGLAHWAARLEAEAARPVDERFWRGGSAGLVNLGSADGSGAKAAALVSQEAAGAGAAMVALDEHLWARGRGAGGEVRLSADLRTTSGGGSIELSVERGGVETERSLEDLGLAVFRDGAGLRASAGPEDFSLSAEELSLLAARAFATALGRAEPAGPRVKALDALAAEIRRDRKSAAELAALVDGREPFARAEVIGLIDGHEALAATPAYVNGRLVFVGALRDPDTGLLTYARATRLDGEPLPPAELRALLSPVR